MVQVNNDEKGLAKTAEKAVFFQDVVSFLKELVERPMELTEKGNLRRKEIRALEDVFHFEFVYKDKEGKPFRSIRTEDDFRYLKWVRQIVAVGKFVYKRKGKLKINKQGREFLGKNIGEQFQSIVDIQFYGANWLYPHKYNWMDRELEILQNRQAVVWIMLQKEAQDWVNYEELDRKLFKRFQARYDRELDAGRFGAAFYWVVHDMLCMLGLVELQGEKEGGFLHREIDKVRLTGGGRAIFAKLDRRGPKWPGDRVSQEEVDEKLDEMLNSLGIRDKISPEEIRSVIYHAPDKGGTNEIMNALEQYTTDKKQFTLLMETLTLAWNHSPHKTLNNLSPEEKARESYEGETIKTRPQPVFENNVTSIYELVGEDLPEEISLEEMSEGRWGMKLSRAYYRIKQEIMSLNPWEMYPEEVESLGEKLLKQEPTSPIVMLLLRRAYLDQGKERQARELMESGVRMLKNLFPKDFELDLNVFPWSILDNRDFLTFFLDYAFFVQAFEGERAAIEHFEYVLNLNPNDNQGVRGILMTAYIKTGQLEKALSLAGEYKNDITQEIILGKVLCLYKLRKKDEARAVVREQWRYIQHTVEELLKDEHEEVEIDPERVQVGGRDEAYLCWLNHGGLWSTTKGALAWLKTVSLEIEKESDES